VLSAGRGEQEQRSIATNNSFIIEHPRANVLIEELLMAMKSVMKMNWNIEFLAQIYLC